MNSPKDRVLIVDDDHDMRSQIKRILSFAMPELELSEAEDGIQALTHLKETRTNVVLCDIHLPGCNGFAVLRSAGKEHPETKFIMVTGMDEPDSPLSALRLGASDYLKKPFGTEELIQALRRAITRQHAEHELASYHQHLSEIIEKQKKKAQISENSDDKLSEIKARFIAVISHEFRTPLTIILSAAQLVRKYADKLSPEERNSALAKIENNVKNMSSLIESLSLLDRTQTDSFHLETETTDIKAFCRKIIGDVAEGCNHHHKWQILTPENHEMTRLDCTIDKRLVRIILTNLLTNAFKYSPPGSLVELRLAKNKNSLKIDVVDQGCGIPEADQQKIFEIFKRASNADAIKGSGLGLYLARQMAKAHGGTLSFRSSEGKGSTFRLEIPMDTNKNPERLA